MAPATRIECHYTLPFRPEQVWAVLSQTDWINRALGLPPVRYAFAGRPEGGSVVRARARWWGLEVRWEEFPFEWTEPEFYRVRRLFENGPFREANLSLELRVTAEGDTRVVLRVDLAPRGLMGRIIGQHWLGPKLTRDFQHLLGHVEQFLHGYKDAPLPRLVAHPVQEPALSAGLERLRAAGQPAELIGRLEGFLRTAPDLALSQVRPWTLGRRWGEDRWAVLRLFLHAAQAGLVDLRWEVLCPHCRGAHRPPATSLRQIVRAAHCDVCQVAFEATFDQSVELKFSVNPAVRPREDLTYCLAGPGGQPHVLSQTTLAAGQRRAWTLPEITHPLRLRSPQVKEPVKLRPDDAPTPVFQPVILCQPDQFVVRYEYGKIEDYAVQVLNPNPFPVQLILEEIQWSEDILTAAQVTNWQEFRDLFAAEVVGPREQIAVDSQVVLVTDLRGSTALDQGLGDAAAYPLMRHHFQVFHQAVQARHGAVVTTVGDAVMAVFSHVGEALGAVREMHELLPAVNPNPSLATRLLPKSSLHVGPCLAVNARDRLDYFGGTINLAARLVECCQGGDLIVSERLFQHPETAEFLKSVRRTPQAAEVRLRGFENPHKVWRIELP